MEQDELCHTDRVEYSVISQLLDWYIALPAYWKPLPLNQARDCLSSHSNNFAGHLVGRLVDYFVAKEKQSRE